MRPRLPLPRGGLWILLLFATLLIYTIPLPTAEAQGELVLQADIEGAITRGTLEYLREVVEVATRDGAAAIVLRLETPGGGLAETQEMVKLMLETPIPFIGFVSPVGASALSAGTMILMATDVAAMAPGTTIGSLQPVIITAEGFQPIDDPKIINALVAEVHEILVAHGRNETLADAFIRENLNLNATQAVAAGATEFVADDVPDLLAQLDGEVTHFKQIALSFQNPTIRIQAPSISLQVLTFITDPIVGSILLLLGIYGVIFGISAPGYGPEVFGTIAILLGLIALGFNVNLIALGLIGIGIALLIVEIATPSFGALGAGGIVAIVLGSLFLAPISPPTVLIAPPAQLEILLILLIPTAILGAFLLFAVYKVLQARRAEPFHDQMVGGRARTVDPLTPGKEGYVRYEGELWSAIADASIPANTTVYIHAREETVLTVKTEPLPEPETEGTSEVGRKGRETPLTRLRDSVRTLWGLRGRP